MYVYEFDRGMEQRLVGIDSLNFNFGFSISS